MTGPIDVSSSPHVRLRPLDGASIDGGFWGDRRRLNREVLIPGAQNADLKAALQGARPIVAEHLDHAKMIAASLK